MERRAARDGERERLVRRIRLARRLSIPVALLALLSLVDLAAPMGRSAEVIVSEKSTTARGRGGTNYELHVTEPGRERRLLVSRRFYRRVPRGATLRISETPIYRIVRHAALLRGGRPVDAHWFWMITLPAGCALFGLSTLVSWRMTPDTTDLSAMRDCVVIEVSALLGYPLALYVAHGG